MSIDKEQNDKELYDFFDENFEVTYDGASTKMSADLNTDAYKDVLSALSELDDTHSFDYLEANKTKVIQIDEATLKEAAQDTANPFEKALESCKKLINTITPGKK